jgi:2-oxoglutarate ferredoxin oxidoreductase subunit alpha
MPDYGTGYRYHTTGLFHDETGFPRGKNSDARKLMDRLMAKVEDNLDDIILYDEDIEKDDDIIVLSYGSTVRSAISAVNDAREKDLNAGWIKLKTIWPFPEEIVKDLAEKADTIIVPELNRGQLIREVERHVKGKADVIGINRDDGTLIKPEDVLAEIEEVS